MSPLATLGSAVALIWVGGSLAIYALMPWPWLVERGDRPLAWALVAAWPIVLAVVAGELWIEHRKRRA